MKKVFYLAIASLLLCSCSNSNNKQNVVNRINVVKESSSLTVSSTVSFNGSNISRKTGYYFYDEANKFKAYSFVINSDSKYYNPSPKGNIVESFCLENKELLKVSNNKYNFTNNTNSILEYLGLEELFSNVSLSKKIDSKINVSSILNVARDAFYDLGFVNDYQNIIDETNIDYSFKLKEDILTISFNLTSVYRKIFPNIKEGIKTYTFKTNVDKDNFVEFPSSSGSGTGDEKPNDEQLKIDGLNYVKNLYSKLEYLYNNLNLIYRYPLSGKITYEYFSSKPNLLTNAGILSNVTNDEEIEMTIIAKYNNEEYARASFKFIVCPKIIRNGTLGSKENPIYQGRKAINQVEIYFIEMHEQYGDSIYIKAGDFDMLIDAGQNSDGYYVSRFVSEHCVDSCLDMVVATHAHSDHIGGMNSVLNVTKSITYALDYGYQKANYNLSNTVRNNMKNKAYYYSAVTDALKVNNGVIYISEDFYITLLDTGQYLTPQEDINEGDDNDASVTFIMTYKNQSYYFSGDLGRSGESYLASSNQLKKVDLMKASHHGSASSNTSNLLNKIKPSVICVSTALIDRGTTSLNSSNQIHPTKDALNRFYNVGAKVYCNFTMGTIKVTSLGTGSLSVEGLGLSSPYYINGRVINNEENIEFKNTAWANRYRR